MTKRAYNFNAGPSAMPLEVLQQVQTEFLDFQGTGMSIVEISHRSESYDRMHNETIALLRELMGIPSGYEVMFIQGGGSMQFLMSAANFFTKKRAGYIDTGIWAHKAMEAASGYGEVYAVASSADRHHSYIPQIYEIKSDTSYVHITANNTIYGTEFKIFPKFAVPLLCDMSSDILSRSVNVADFDLIYGGVQKNIGPAGVIVAIVKKELLATARQDLPIMLQYKTFAAHNSLYNTPPVFCIYMVNKVLHWIKNQGGVVAMEKRNIEKAKLLYDAIDESNGFYQGHAEPAYRSNMNITFHLKMAELEKQFLDEAKENNFVGLKGHRLIGGCRASAYNAVPVEACEALARFMRAFKAKH